MTEFSPEASFEVELACSSAIFQVDTHKVLMKESGVNLTLTVVDTPGFGDAVDNSGCWDPVTQYVEAQYESFLDAETRVNRVTLPDGRVCKF